MSAEVNPFASPRDQRPVGLMGVPRELLDTAAVETLTRCFRCAAARPCLLLVLLPPLHDSNILPRIAAHLQNTVSQHPDHDRREVSKKKMLP